MNRVKGPQLVVTEQDINIQILQIPCVCARERGNQIITSLYCVQLKSTETDYEPHVNLIVGTTH